MSKQAWASLGWQELIAPLVDNTNKFAKRHYRRRGHAVVAAHSLPAALEHAAIVVIDMTQRPAKRFSIRFPTKIEVHDKSEAPKKTRGIAVDPGVRTPAVTYSTSGDVKVYGATDEKRGSFYLGPPPLPLPLTFILQGVVHVAHGALLERAERQLKVGERLGPSLDAQVAVAVQSVLSNVLVRGMSRPLLWWYCVIWS